MVPTIESVAPASGSAAGGELVRLTTRGLAPRVDVRFGDARAEIIGVRSDGPLFVLDVRTPPGAPGDAPLAIANLGADGVLVPAETARATFRFLRAPIGRESDLTRLVRALLRALKDQVLANTATPMSLDYRETTTNVVPIAKVPSLTVLGPDVRENRLYSSSELVERVVATPAGIEIESLRPPTAVDLRFVLEAVTNSTAEHLELFAALVAFFHRNPYLVLGRDPLLPEAGTVRFVLACDGEARAATVQSEDGRAGRTDDRRAFQWGLVVRGFPVDEHIAIERAAAVPSGVDIRIARTEPRS
jgi:hypothetical protein